MMVTKKLIKLKGNKTSWGEGLEGKVLGATDSMGMG